MVYISENFCNNTYKKIKPILNKNSAKDLLNKYVVVNLSGDVPTVAHDTIESANDAVNKALENGGIKGTYIVCEIKTVHALEMHTYK